MVSEAGLDELENYLEVAEITQVMEATRMGGGGHPSKFVVVFPGGGGALGKAEDAGGEAPAVIRRERAAWLLARALGWGDLVAATVLRHVEKPSGPALCSLQMIWPAFSPNVPEGSLPDDDRWRGAIFDALIKMADRGGGNWLGVPADATLLGKVREQAERFHRREEELDKARADLIAAMRAANEEGVPIARIAREAGVSRPTAYDWIRRG